MYKILLEENFIFPELYKNLGELYSKLGEYRKAIEYYDRFLQLQDIDEKSRIGIRIEKTKVLLLNGDHKEVKEEMELMDKEEEIIKGYEKEYVEWLTLKGEIERDINSNYDRALEYHFKALKIRKSSLPENHPHIAFSYHNIGIIYFLEKLIIPTDIIDQKEF